MTGSYQLALTGDVIMNTRVSGCRDQDVLAAVLEAAGDFHEQPGLVFVFQWQTRG